LLWQSFLVANASKHSAISHERAQQQLIKLQNEVAILTDRAERADRQSQAGCETKLPEEIARREKRIASIREAALISAITGKIVVAARHESAKGVWGNLILQMILNFARCEDAAEASPTV
jgi:hypothetical protein